MFSKPWCRSQFMIIIGRIHPRQVTRPSHACFWIGRGNLCTQGETCKLHTDPTSIWTQTFYVETRSACVISKYLKIFQQYCRYDSCTVIYCGEGNGPCLLCGLSHWGLSVQTIHVLLVRGSFYFYSGFFLKTCSWDDLVTQNFLWTWVCGCWLPLCFCPSL